jgi:hypothetical protein
LDQDAGSGFLITVQEHGTVVARSAEDLECLYLARALEGNLPFNDDCSATAEGSQRGTSGWIAVIGFQAGLLGSCRGQANE